MSLCWQDPAAEESSASPDPQQLQPVIEAKLLSTDPVRMFP